MNADIEKEVSRCVQTIRDGGFIIFPSEIGWSIGCDASDEANVNAVISSSDYEYPSILLSDTGRLGKFAKTIPDAIWDLIEFTTKPLHLVVDEMINFPSLPFREIEDVAFRIVKDEFTIALTSKFGKPVFAAVLSSDSHPEKTNSILNKNCYVVNLRVSAKANPQNLVIIRLLKNEKFEIIRK